MWTFVLQNVTGRDQQEYTRKGNKKKYNQKEAGSEPPNKLVTILNVNTRPMTVLSLAKWH